jgi:DNA mismatch repair protein MutH
MKFNNKIDLESEEQLLQRCQNIEGLSIGQLTLKLKIRIPINPLQRKGFVGSAVELALGTTAKNKASPDFCSLGIELKTLPINHLGKPAESTFVTSIPLLTIQQETWESSQCFSKLKRVLWLPIEGDKSIEFLHRRIGRAILWSPSISDEEILKKDWTEFVLMISTGKLAEINASMGEYLQIRPKAANGKSLCYGYDETGSKVLTMPRGFYLRASFTGKILS